MKLRGSSPPSPVGWTPLTDITDEETNERTDGQSVRSFVHLLDWVWHFDCKQYCVVSNSAKAQKVVYGTRSLWVFYDKKLAADFVCVDFAIFDGFSHHKVLHKCEIPLLPVCIGYCVIFAAILIYVTCVLITFVGVLLFFSVAEITCIYDVMGFGVCSNVFKVWCCCLCGEKEDFTSAVKSIVGELFPFITKVKRN